MYGPLPIFPIFYSPTEAKIEALVERLFDRADALLMQGEATQQQYDAWAERLADYVKHLEGIKS